MDEDEARIHRAFESLREDDASRTPPFAPMLRAARRPTQSSRTLVVALSGASAVAALGLVLVATSARRAPPARPPASASAPLDFLLSAPTHDVVARVPDFDTDPTKTIASSIPAGLE